MDIVLRNLAVRPTLTTKSIRVARVCVNIILFPTFQLVLDYLPKLVYDQGVNHFRRFTRRRGPPVILYLPSKLVVISEQRKFLLCQIPGFLYFKNSAISATNWIWFLLWKRFSLHWAIGKDYIFHISQQGRFHSSLGNAITREGVELLFNDDLWVYNLLCLTCVQKINRWNSGDVLNVRILWP